MPNPYRVLGAAPEDDDAAIRRRYLEAVKRFPPDRRPDEFQRIRDAHERIKDEGARLAFLLFDPSQGESIEDLIAEERCRTLSNRPGLGALLRLLDQTR